VRHITINPRDKSIMVWEEEFYPYIMNWKSIDVRAQDIANSIKPFWNEQTRV
jgi:hypothetical protein